MMLQIEKNRIGSSCWADMADTFSLFAPEDSLARPTCTLAIKINRGHLANRAPHTRLDFTPARIFFRLTILPRLVEIYGLPADGSGLLELNYAEGKLRRAVYSKNFNG